MKKMQHRGTPKIMALTPRREWDAKGIHLQGSLTQTCTYPTSWFQHPSESLASLPGMGPVPCKRLRRDSRAPSVLLLMREVIILPRVGPMSAEMGEVVSVTGSLQGPGTCRKAGENTDIINTPPSSTPPGGGQWEYPHPPTTCITLPREEPEWGKAATGAELELGRDSSPSRHPHKNQPSGHRVSNHPQGRKANPHNTPTAQKPPALEQLPTGPWRCSSPSSCIPSPWRLRLA